MVGPHDPSASSGPNAKGPVIPVRMNRRTTLKPLSQLQGDNLPLLKKLRTSELTQRVKGHNASEELKMKRLLGQWFTDQQWRIEKTHKRQLEVYQQLARIHNERREMHREMYIWHQEEERMQRILEEESSKVIAESQRVSKFLESGGARRMSLLPTFLKKHRPSLIDGSDTPDIFGSSRASFDSVNHRSSFSSFLEQKKSPNRAAEDNNNEPPRESSAATATVSPTRNHLDDNDNSGGGGGGGVHGNVNKPVETVAPETTKRPRNIILKAKVLQVNREKPFEPLLRERSKELIELPSDNEISSQSKSTSTSPRRIETKDSHHLLPANNQIIDEIKHANKLESSSSIGKKMPIIKGKSSNGNASGLPAIPTIKEDMDDNYNWWKAISHSQQLSADRKPKTFSPIQQANVEDEMEEESDDGDEEEEEQPPITRQSQVQLNRESRKRRDEAMRKLLDEPFTAYRKSRDGDFLPMENLPTPFPSQEPSNKDKYKTERILKIERSHFLDHLVKLQQYTTEIVAQEERDRELRAQVRRDVPVVEKKKESDIPTIGPLAWIRVFVHNDIPKGMDPNSPEALKYCRYIRRPEPQNVDLRLVLPEKDNKR